MQLIPVLDLLGGHAVRAVRGARTDYRPIHSTLAGSSEPLALARALVARTRAPALYVADLDAILGRGAHVAAVAALREALPGIAIWLDAGFRDYAAMRATFDRIENAARDLPPFSPLPPSSPRSSDSSPPPESPEPESPLPPKPSLSPESSRSSPSPARETRAALGVPNVPPATLVPVFGTESLRDGAALDGAQADGFAPILSLDHRAGRLVADAALARAFERGTLPWPSRAIAMTLDQVGSYAGPDLDTFERVRAAAPSTTAIIGAGGIRDEGDLLAAAAAGASAWLVASALHDLRLDINPLRHRPLA